MRAGAVCTTRGISVHAMKAIRATLGKIAAQLNL